jgi:adenylyltransferase/sulfurtransferase
MQEISPEALQQWLLQPDPPVLVDVREDFEREVFHIGGLHIPLGELNARLGEIPKNKSIVFYCARGIRSAIAIQRLAEKGFTNLFNLNGGIYKWQVSFK